MQNDDLPEPLCPLMMQLNVCLNLSSSLMTDLAVYPTPSFKRIRMERTCCHISAVSSERDPVNHILGVCDYIYSAIRPLSFNIALGVHRNCFSKFASHQGLNDVETDLGGAVIQRYSSDFTHCFAIVCHGIHHPIGIFPWPTAYEFFDVKARFQLWYHSSKTVSRFNQRKLGSRLYIYHTVGVTIQRSLLYPVEISVQKNYCHGRDVYTDKLVCVP